MKMQVQVMTLSKETLTVNLEIAQHETVKDVKERLALIEPNPFPDQVLKLDGKSLSDDVRAVDCIKDGAVFGFEANVSEGALAKQLEDLLRAKGGLQIEELGLLYCLQHGVTIGQALQAVGKDELFQAFVERFDKVFLLKNGVVQLARPDALPQVVAKALDHIPEDAPVQTITVAVAVAFVLPFAVQTLEAVRLEIDSSCTVAHLKDLVAAEALIPFTERTLTFRGKALDDASRLCACGVVDASSLEFRAIASEDGLAQQLTDVLKAKGATSQAECDQVFSLRFGAGAGAALKMLGWGEKLKEFLQRHPCFDTSRPGVKVAKPLSVDCAKAKENQRYVDLQARLCPDGFQKVASDALDELSACIAEHTFVNIGRVVRGGSVANGTAISGAASAELALTVAGLPPSGLGSLPGLASSVAKGLAEHLAELPGVKEVQTSGSTFRLKTAGPLEDVCVSLVPDYASFSDAVEALRQQEPAGRADGAAAFTAQRTRFVERQPEAIKATVRLMKWWRNQRQWSSDLSRPGDYLIEALVVHAISQKTPRDLCEACAQVLSVMASFSELAVTWPLALRSFREADADPTVMQQRPLILDPANPLCNLADAQAFQPLEMATHAASGFF